MNVSLDHSLASEAADTADPGSSHRDVSTAFSDPVQRCSFSQPPMVQPANIYPIFGVPMGPQYPKPTKHHQTIQSPWAVSSHRHDGRQVSLSQRKFTVSWPPCTTFRTPGGSPQSLAISASIMAWSYC